jgi:hypothetical protein
MAIMWNSATSMRAQVVWQINRVADCQQLKSAVGWSPYEFRLIPLLREFDFKSGICLPGNAYLPRRPDLAQGFSFVCCAVHIDIFADMRHKGNICCAGNIFGTVHSFRYVE